MYIGDCPVGDDSSLHSIGAPGVKRYAPIILVMCALVFMILYNYRRLFKKEGASCPTSKVPRMYVRKAVECIIYYVTSLMSQLH